MKYTGNNVSGGIAIGEVFLYTPFIPPEVEKALPQGQQPSDAVAHYHDAKEKAKAELEKIKEKLLSEKDEKAKIFTAHLDILYDEVMDEDILFYIEGKGFSAVYSVGAVYDKYATMLDKAADELIRERAADIRDVKNRLLRNLFGMEERNLSALSKPVIVVANNLLPSDTATLDRKNVLAIVTETGGETSHSAIIAKSYEIPAILGVKNIMSVLKQDETVIVDAVKGDLYTAPDGDQLSHFAEERIKYVEKAKKIKEFIGVEPVMKDGQRVGVFMNIGAGKAEELQSSVYTDGIGLFRTEFLYMEKDQAPTEDEQFAAYSKVLSAFGDKPVILRTLDIGGDKTVSYLDLPKEENPFLGNRALRLCLSRLEIFRTQLRAALRASISGNLWIMLPMVGSLDDIRKAKLIIEEVKGSLRKDQIPFSDQVKIGIMIEIPSIALMADIVAQ